LKTNSQTQPLSVQIAPVPSESVFTLTVTSLSKEQVEVNIYDVVGKRIEQLKGSANENYGFGQRYAAGTYIVEVLQGSHRITQVIVKQ
jgi:type IX secretion system substrate protein